MSGHATVRLWLEYGWKSARLATSLKVKPAF